MEIAIIGLPQTGKTTLLNALTRGRAESGAFGGARQEVRVGVSRMADPRLDTIVQIFGPDKVVSLEVKYWDVPVGSEASSASPSIGGELLNLLQNADALLHVVRAFDDPSVPHVSGGVDPHRDVANMEGELALSDLGILERRIQRIDTSLKGASAHERDALNRERSVIGRLKEGLEQDVPVREQDTSPDESDILSNYQLLTAKPMLIVLNLDEGAISRLPELEADLSSRYGGRGLKATALCGKLEMELSQLSPEDEREFRESMDVRDPGLDRVVRLSYDLLSLISFFTYVSKEVRAWSIPTDTTAVKAAGKIHSDMERGFIRAEVVAFDDLARCGSVAQCRKEGLLRVEGKSYPVKDGDVITFLFNV